jgi:hypothetical protein
MMLDNSSTVTEGTCQAGFRDMEGPIFEKLLRWGQNESCSLASGGDVGECTKVASDRLSEPPSSRTSLALLSHLRRMSSGTSQPGQTSLMTRPAGASTDLRCGPTLVFHPTPCKSSLLPHGSSMSSCRVWLEIVLHRWRYRESKTTVRIRTGLLPESALSSVRSGRVACALRVCSEGQGVAGLSGEKARRVLWLTRFWYCQERMSHLNAFAHRRIHCRIAFVRRRKAWMPSP